MTSTAYIFLPDIPFVNDAKSKEQIANALNQKYPAAKFDSSKIIISRKQNKHNAYAQTTQEHQQKLLQLKQIKIGGQTILLKKCFPNHQIYINKIPQSISKQQISNYFGQFGKIVNIQLFAAEGSYQNPKEKASINHCYIRFQKDEDAEKCLFSEDRHSIKNKDDIRVVRAYKIGQNDQTDKKLFLKITPIVQFDINKIQKELYNHFKGFGELRQKIKIQQLSNLSSKAIITFTNLQAGQNALQNFKLNTIQQYILVLRPYASKQSYMAFLGSLKAQTTEADLKSALSRYGKIVSCTLNPSKKPGIINAVATFADQQSFKLALSDYKNNAQLVQFFAYKPYMDVHMNASLRNDYNNFKRKDKKPNDSNFMNMGGIGVGFGVPPRGNQFPPTMIGGNQPFGFNPQIQMGLGLTPPSLLMGTNVKVPPPPPQNFRPF